MSSRLPRRGTGPAVGRTEPGAGAAARLLAAAGVAPGRVAEAPEVGKAPGVAAGLGVAAVPEKAPKEVLAIMTGQSGRAVVNGRLTRRRDQLGSTIPRSDCSAWIPGSVLPSSHSRNAPPAVDT